jgi:hypothetical protein
MLVYTGNAYAEDDLDNIQQLGMGIMLAASSAGYKPDKKHRAVPCALDNGAFQCWQRGFPFMADVFRSALADAYKAGLILDFIVTPDIVAGGQRSLDYSISWAQGELLTAQRLALAVQDGIGPEQVRNTGLVRRFTYIFVGGTEDWKWSTGEMWVKFAHDYGLKCHIGRCGTLERLMLAASWGTDSVDSTNFVRNKSWHVVEEFHRKQTLPLFGVL